MLPNSIQRTAPIVGYDPYAFIMGNKSNIAPQGMRGGYVIDYYAKRPEDMYTSGEKAKKRFNFTPFLKDILALGAVLVGTTAFLIGKDKTKAVNAASSVAGSAGASGSGGGKVAGTLGKAKDAVFGWAKSAGNFISNKFHTARASGSGGGKVAGTLGKAKDAVFGWAKSAGNFISNKFHAAGAFIKGKFHKTP